MRVALFAKTPQKFARLRRYCDRHGWHVSAEFADRGRLLARAGRYDAVLVEHFADLISSNPFDAFRALHRLLEENVALEVAAEPSFCTMGPRGPAIAEISAWVLRHRRFLAPEQPAAG